MSSMSHEIRDATYGSVREAVQLAREGVTTRLEGSVGLSAEEAFKHARSLLNDGDGVRLRLDSPWLVVEPEESD